MKLRANTLRVFTAVHSWVGLVAGFALFVAFYAGAITMFHHELPVWQASAVEAEPDSIADAQRLFDEVLARHDGARVHLGFGFPGAESAQASAWWLDGEGIWQFATLDTLQGSPTPPTSSLAELVNLLHFSLGIPMVGTWLMGIVSLLYGLALVSGVVIHLPRLTKDLFALRPGRNLKRFWQDAHNVIGVLSLPAHVMFAVTGAVLCLLFVLMPLLNPLVYDGKLMAAVPAAMDTAPVVAASGEPAAMQSLAQWHARSVATARENGIDDFEPAYLKLQHGGDANAVVEITGETSRALGAMGSVALDAGSGEVLAVQLQGARDANHATLQATYALHFGEFGNRLVQWLYFLLGLAGAFLFYSGNLLWIESRRKRRALEQGRAQVNMARATIGVCIGVCVAISASFVAAQLAPMFGLDTAVAERWACFGTWALCALWAALRPPSRGVRELLWLAALVTLAIPIAHGFASGWPLWKAAAAGHWVLVTVDTMAIVLAAAFAALARASARRGREGDPHSVWADPRPGAVKQVS
ncbi:PepSY-associated TM helix domain-containing protein [Lysobacter sp. A286]